MKKFALPITVFLLFSAISFGGAAQFLRINHIEKNGVITNADVIGASVTRHSDGRIKSGSLKVQFLPQELSEPIETSISLSGYYLDKIVGISKISIKTLEIKYLPESPHDAFAVGEAEKGLAIGMFAVGLILALMVAGLTLKPYLRRS